MPQSRKGWRGAKERVSGALRTFRPPPARRQVDLRSAVGGSRRQRHRCAQSSHQTATLQASSCALRGEARRLSSCAACCSRRQSGYGAAPSAAQRRNHCRRAEPTPAALPCCSEHRTRSPTAGAKLRGADCQTAAECSSRSVSLSVAAAPQHEAATAETAADEPCEAAARPPLPHGHSAL